ncbi:phospholipid/cholesterol/gamma-HCH transport system ATP-binding protein [Lewinella marina]|uniref:ABC transporter ATP-binding protein n=1 Tax=Neolewinella marina TaxID=438751 RepID=A0A2G0CKC8_9BACT|nr:ATP-binding cassette domain-containing protein [Neolewinella marina]NJB84409.1 phospholipid/cholesterol/gamma-HCH transport system ATP-binding protein [Neolewinella marina]PHL00398.1 ABC transporter ATP-binding protein [Neolewinella marina]
MIRTENIVKSFGDNDVLKGITTEFYAGKPNLIIGSSGAGKTVLLKLLIGLFQPTSGKVYYDDIDLFSLSDERLREIRMKVGMLFQGNALFDSMTVGENIRFPMDMFTKMTLKEKEKRVDECLEMVNMEGVNDRYPSEVSGGMQKRVGIARAMVLEPKYLFCDEPNSGLDPKTSILIDELICDLTTRNNITTVINTHDMNSVMGIGDNIVLLKDGNLVWQGDKTQVLESKSSVLQDFIFASPFLRRLREDALKQRHAQE